MFHEKRFGIILICSKIFKTNYQFDLRISEYTSSNFSDDEQIRYKKFEAFSSDSVF